MAWLKKILGTSPKTSAVGWIAGLGLLCEQLGHFLQGQPVDTAIIVAAISAILAGIMARDNSVDSESAGAK